MSKSINLQKLISKKTSNKTTFKIKNVSITVLNTNIDSTTSKRIEYILLSTLEIIDIYTLSNCEIQIQICDIEGLGEAKPSLKSMIFKTPLVVTITLHLVVLDNNLISKDAIKGLLAHECSHVYHYQYMSIFHILHFGLSYIFSKQRRTDIEKYTDLTTLVFGYGLELAEQKKATKQDMKRRNLKDRSSNYLSSKEIEYYSKNKDKLLKQLKHYHEKIKYLNIPYESLQLKFLENTKSNIKIYLLKVNK